MIHFSRTSIHVRLLTAACVWFAGCQATSGPSINWEPITPQTETASIPTLESELTDLESQAFPSATPSAPRLELEPEAGSTSNAEPAPPQLSTSEHTLDREQLDPPTIAATAELLTEATSPAAAPVIGLPWSSKMPQPLRGISDLPTGTRPLSLDEAIHLALENTTVLRSLGAQILNNPEGTATAFDPWIVSSDPRAGADAALAEFDTNLNSRINYANNDDVFNNAVLGGGANEIQQDLVNSSLQLQKFTSTGALYSLTGAIDYDDNTRPSNLFPSSYDTRLEAQIRQPLMQGRGKLFNSIAGPSARVDRQGGTGILIAQTNIDVSVVQFERNVTAFVNEIISAYWNLHLAYQNVEIALASFEQAEKTWQVASSKNKTGLSGGEAYREALAREQRDRLEVELLESIHSTGQTGTVGLLQAEARLRLLVKLPNNSHVLVYPIDDPIASSTVFDLDSLKQAAIVQRVEVREQTIRVERDQMQVMAAKNFLLPRLDAVATYRNNGFGDTLGIGGSAGFASALDVAAEGLYDEWEIGLQYDVVLGTRRARAGVKNSRLRLRRSKLVLQEIQDRIHFDVDTALRSAARSELTFAASSRLKQAAQESYESHQAAFQSGFTTIDELLRAQQRLADAQRTFHRQNIDRTLAVESIFRETGSLLQMHGVKSDCPSLDINLLSSNTASH